VGGFKSEWWATSSRNDGRLQLGISSGVSTESHEVAIQRMIAAGANPMTWMALAGEWQRNWARTEHVEELTQILIDHLGGSGIAYLWEQQLLNTPVPSNAR
jgi:nicotinamidase-related amidase